MNPARPATLRAAGGLLRLFARHAAPVLAAAALAACGGGGGSSTSTTPVSTVGGSTTLTNFAPMVVDLGPTVSGAPVGAVNQAYVTVKVCVPNTSTCVSVDHVWVDTGSTGLRLVASALNGLNLPAVTDNGTSSGSPLAECYPFIATYMWGVVHSADVTIGGSTASAIPVQVLGESTTPAVPADCSSTGGTQQQTVTDLYANGLLGVANFTPDCGTDCESGTQSGAYYVCPSTGCVDTTVTAAQQLPQPVTRFPNDNNGVILSLPSVSAAGGASATGTLTFGVGTETNNTLTGTVLTLDDNGFVSTTFGSTGAYPDSFVDSGSNALYFSDAGTAALVDCTSTELNFLYCPSSTLSLNAVMTGKDPTTGNTTSAQKSVAFSVANANTLFTNQPSYAAFANLAGPNPPISGVGNSFDWGLPFFYGRSVAFVVSGNTVGTNQGPFIAY